MNINIEYFLDAFEFFKSFHLDSSEIIHEIKIVRRMRHILSCLDLIYSLYHYHDNILFSFLDVLETICWKFAHNSLYKVDDDKEKLKSYYEKLFPDKSENGILEVLKQKSQIMRDLINKVIQ